MFFKVRAGYPCILASTSKHVKYHSSNLPTELQLELNEVETYDSKP